MTYPIQSGSPFRTAQIGESRQTLLPFSELLRSVQTSYCLLFTSSSSIDTMSKTHLIYGPLASILLDQGFPVEYELDEFNTLHTGTTLSRLQYWLCRLRCKIPPRRLATSPLGNIFWRHSRFSPKQPEPQTHGDYKRFCPQTANTTFAKLMARMFPSTHSTMP